MQLGSVHTGLTLDVPTRTCTAAQLIVSSELVTAYALETRNQAAC
jgi:hypothetical protein